MSADYFEVVHEFFNHLFIPLLLAAIVGYVHYSLLKRVDSLQAQIDSLVGGTFAELRIASLERERKMLELMQQIRTAVFEPPVPK